MKTMIKALSMMTALLLMTACSSEIDDVLTGQPDGKEYVSIPFSATVDGLVGTRAGLNGSKQYVFETGDKLYVEGTGVYGYLTLKAGDEDKRTGATFEGNLNVSGTPASTLALNAILVSSTDALHTIAGDKVTATTYPTTAVAATETEAIQKYSHFTGSATYGTPSFTLNQQSAFISFDITLKDGTATSTDVAVSISNDGGVVRTGSITTATVGTDIKAQFVAAFPGGSTTLSDASVTLGTRPAISFGGSTALAVNKIYQVTKGYVDLSTLTANYEARNGDMLYGIHNAGNISIASGATVTLKDATINKAYYAAGISCTGDATIIIEGSNDVKGHYQDYPGIYIPKNKTLTIQGSGSLIATSGGGENKYGTGIGGSNTLDCGNIIIKGGIITANGGTSQAGIGGGSNNKSCGNISIDGGVITANGGYYGAAIGSGDTGSCGTITITDGVTLINATKTNDGAAYIGAGCGGTCGTVTIDGVANATTASSFTHFTSSVSGNTWTLANNNAPALSKALSAVTSSEVGWRIGSDGKAYSPVGTLPAGVTAVAMIAYVGAAGSADASSTSYKGLALALSDVSGTHTWSSTGALCFGSGHQYATSDAAKEDMAGIANTDALVGHTSHTHAAASAARNYKYTETVAVGTHPTGTSAWFLPSAGQWDKMIGTGGYGLTNLTTSANGYKGLETGDSYWSSSESNVDNAWFFYADNGDLGYYPKDFEKFVRSCLAF